MDAGADHDAALAAPPASAAGTSAPTGAKMIAASSGSGGALVGVAGPHRAELAGELLRRGVARPREGEDPPALVARHLGHDVRRGAEAVDAEPLARRPPCRSARYPISPAQSSGAASTSPERRGSGKQ